MQSTFPVRLIFSDTSIPPSPSDLLMWAQTALRRLSSVRDILRIGSSTIPGCVPNDYDIMVMLRNEEEENEAVFLAEWVETHGRLFGGLSLDTKGLYDNTHWCSVRVCESPINLILTTNGNFFRAQRIAQRVCERLRLTDRGERLLVFKTLHLEYM